MKDQEYIFTGHRRIDIPTYGLKPGQLVAVGSKTSGGKTSFAIDCALHASGKQDIPTIYFSLERSKANLEKRITPKETIVPDKLIIDDTPALSIDDFEIKLKNSIVEHGVRLAIIDYVQLMRGPEEMKGYRIQEMGHIVHKLKDCAEKFGITLIMLSQMSEYPFLGSYFRESPEIEEQSDVVIEIEDYIPNVKKLAVPKIPLKEDGSLNVERIDSLPLEEKKRVVESMNQAQFKEYYSKGKRISKESQPSVRVIEVDYGFDDPRSGVDAWEFLKKLDEEDDEKKE